MNSIKVRQLFDYDTWTYTYLVWDSKTVDAIIIGGGMAATFIKAKGFSVGASKYENLKVLIIFSANLSNAYAILS